MSDNDENKRPMEAKNKVIIIAAFAVLILVVVIFTIVQKNPEVISAGGSDIPTGNGVNVIPEQTVTEWPGTQFPEIPTFETESYSVAANGKHLSIYLSPSDLDNLNSYITTLKNSGAQLYCEDEYSTILGIGNVEIQILKDAAAPQIILCGEDSCEFTLAGFDNYILPDSGRLVSAVQSTDSTDTAYLMYRNLSYSNIKAYCEALEKDGWLFLEGEAPETESTPFMSTYYKGSYLVTIDYHSGSSDLTLILSTASTDEA